MFLIGFPLLLIPFALYNMIVFLLNMSFSDTLFGIPLLAGRRMVVSTGDALVLLAVLLLYVEIVKAARPDSKPIMDHLLSLVLFVAMAVEFVAVEPAATSSFLILTALSFVDVIGGVSISLRTARRDLAMEPSDRTEPVG
jgi:hypothetical protein